jgi:integrase
MSKANKTGRKQKHFIDPATGKPVVGLSQRPSDGRWRIIGSQTTFSEPDVAKAIAKFKQLTSSHDPDKLALESIDRQMHPYADKLHPIWRYFAQQIADKPQWVAEATGLEWIAYGPTLKEPAKQPTFQELRKLWEDHATCSVEQMKKVRTAWDHFAEATDANNLRDITSKLAVEYRDVLHASGYGGKTQSHIIAGIRRVLTNAKSRAIAMKEVSTALTYLELLEPSEEAESADPKPIEVADWQKLYPAAETAQDRALLLLCLNGAFYIKEAIDLEWSDVQNGCIITNRQKTGRCIRVCTLWKETQDALAAIERKGEKVFYTYQGLPIKACGAHRRFADIRDKAKLPHVTGSMLRDGAYTAAVESGASFQFCQLLAGHKCGMADKYVKRNPKMVAPACQAIYAKYIA